MGLWHTTRLIVSNDTLAGRSSLRLWPGNYFMGVFQRRRVMAPIQSQSVFGDTMNAKQTSTRQERKHKGGKLPLWEIDTIGQLSLCALSPCSLIPSTTFSTSATLS
jgi:hypothetical protein